MMIAAGAAGTSAHADARYRIKADPRFVLSHSTKTGPQFIFGHHHEPEVLVQRAVPGNVDEGGEGECWTSRFDGPRMHGFEQILAESPTLVLRKDADLFDVGVSIYDIDDDVANRSITFIHGDPTASAAHVVFQHLDRHGIRVGYPVHPDRPEHLSREALDLSEARGFS
jgi:hypothetical protein